MFKHFIEPGAFASMGTAVGIVWVVSCTVQTLIGRRHPVVVFASALGVSIVHAWYASLGLGVIQVVVVFCNACVLFVSSTGMNELIVKNTRSRKRGGAVAASAAPRPRWLDYWIEK